MNTLKPCEKLCLCTCLFAAVIRSPKGEAGVTTKVILINTHCKTIAQYRCVLGKRGFICWCWSLYVPIIPPVVPSHLGFHCVCLDSVAFAESLGDHKIHDSSGKRKDLTTRVGFVTDAHQKQSFSGKKAGVSPSLTSR